METLSDVDERKIAAIVAATVADAAAQPLHWIYNLDRLKSLTDGVEDIEFRHPSANPFYRIPTGSNTCYGDEAYVMLRSLIESKGLNIEHLKQETYKAFGPDSAYENKENQQYQVGREDKINVKKTLPIQGPWRNGCIKDFLANMENGLKETGSVTDDQIDCAIRIIPLVCLYAGHPEMLIKVEEGLRVTMSSDLAVTSALAMARVLEKYIIHGTPNDVLSAVVKDIESRDNPNPQDLDRAVIDLPKSLQATLHGLITSSSFVEGIRATIRVGGCNSSRAGFIGACRAAQEGLQCIPESWTSRTIRYQEVLDLARQLVTIGL